MNDEKININKQNNLESKKKNERNIYVLAIALLLLAIATITTIQNRIEKVLVINGKKISDEKESEGQNCIYISGEIKKEGIVCTDKEETISKAISIAGGINVEADISIIDLDRKIVDGEKLHIISKNAGIEGVDSVDNLIIKEEQSSRNTNANKVNINTATKEELDSLSGIGPSTAEKIIEYRKNTVFESIEELKNVNGIGDSKYNKIVDNICVK